MASKGNDRPTDPHDKYTGGLTKAPVDPEKVKLAHAVERMHILLGARLTTCPHCKKVADERIGMNHEDDCAIRVANKVVDESEGTDAN